MKREISTDIDDLIIILRREQEWRSKRRRILLGMLFDLALVLLCGAAVIAIILSIS